MSRPVPVDDSALPPAVPCPSEKPHKAHAWDEIEETFAVWEEQELEANRTREASFVRHWCRGAGHLRGSL